MIRQLTAAEVQNNIQELIAWEAMEICPHQNNGDEQILIPVVMNDAAECYLRLTGAEIKGEWSEIAAVAFSVYMVESRGKTGILLRAENESANISVYYEQAFLELHCYQYHRIGHNWRKDLPGEEGIRRLVNLLAVLHDKCAYLGEEACNEQELKLCPLMGFSPLVYYTPVSWPILEDYPETEEGIAAMYELALEAGDADYGAQVLTYQNSAHRDTMAAELSKILKEPQHQAVISLLEDLISDASSSWPCRTYDDAEMKHQQQAREAIWQYYVERGWQGNYPEMTRRKNDGKTERIRFYEEHPFTVMESEQYRFRIMEIHDEKTDV